MILGNFSLSSESVTSIDIISTNYTILMSTHNIPFSIFKRKSVYILSYICYYGIFSWGLKNEFETAVVNEPSMFEPLKFYCIYNKSVMTIRFLLLYCCFTSTVTSKVMSGRSVNLTTLFLGRLRPPKRLISTSCTYFCQ